MKNQPKQVELHFDPKKSFTTTGKHVRDGLSTVLRTGDYLWLSCDEQISLERLRKVGESTFAEHTRFDLSEFLDLPDGKKSEIDIEGMGEAGGYLWLIGSHGLKRKKPRKQESMAKQIKRLAKVSSDGNRYLLARIPLVQDATTGEYTLCRECTNSEDASKTLRAGQLMGSGTTNQLIDAIADDPHLKDFLRIPGKDNGFDIEGLAMHEDRIFVGLRGPVLRGWAIIMELGVEETEEEGILELKPQPDGSLYKKHFLHMNGKGVRELRVKGKDIYILAGPTMDLDGVIAVYKWAKGVTQTQEGEQVVHRKELERLFDVPHGSGPTSGQDKAEGLAIYDEEHLLVVFDSPTDTRKPEDDIVVADVFKI